jgi:hypothetical protein
VCDLLGACWWGRGGNAEGWAWRGESREISPQNGGDRCVAITSDSRASCCRHTDGVFYDRAAAAAAAAALQGLGGRVLEMLPSFLVVDSESRVHFKTRVH